jgi:hypothetical protein
MIYKIIDINIMDKIELCKHINIEIKNLNSNEIEEVFRIIHENNTLYTKNNNGIFINLSWMDIDILEKIYKYIKYCIISNSENIKYQNLKEDILLINEECIKNTGDGQIKENDLEFPIIEEIKVDKELSIRKINSNMRFYLIKKKLMKHQNYNSYTFDDILIPEKTIL